MSSKNDSEYPEYLIELAAAAQITPSTLAHYVTDLKRTLGISQLRVDTKIKQKRRLVISDLDKNGKIK